MSLIRVSPLVLGVGLVVGCGDNDTVEINHFPTASCGQVMGSCVEVTADEPAALQAAASSISSDTTIVLGAGTFALNNQVTIRAAGVQLIGQGIDVTTLDFGGGATQFNGVDVIGNNFLVQDLTVLDAPKDGIRVEASKGVTFRRIRATWTTPSLSSNGAYGIYPVKSSDVLVEDSRAENASDAGLYVGQCQNVIVRRNVVRGNVAGLEIENTQYADVYENTAEDNTGGILVFDLPGNPIIGRDVRIRNNVIRNNNHINFAAGGTVATIPVGTGTFALASRRVEIINNTYENNNTSDIAILNGLGVIKDPAAWKLPMASLIGDYEDLNLLSTEPDTVSNFDTENIVVAGNTHSGSGTKPDFNDPGGIGLLLIAQYQTSPVDSVLYDAIREPEFHSRNAEDNSNIHNICVGNNPGGTFASMALGEQGTTIIAFYRPAKPFAPFDCTALEKPIAPVVLP